MSALRVYLATSLDNCIAGPDHDLSWLPTPPEPAGDTPPPDYGYADFMAQIGALLMGRSTYEVVAGFEGPWPYGERPVLVATHRPLDPPAPVPSVRPIAGEIHELVTAAREAAGDKDVYLDGGALVRQALAAGLVDELILTIIPVVLGEGVPLFAGTAARTKLELVSSEVFEGGLVQLRYRPRR